MTVPHIQFNRYNVFSRDQWIVDFVIPVENISDLVDAYWEISMERTVERIMENVGNPNVVAIYDETFFSDPNANFSKGPVDALVYADSSSPPPNHDGVLRRAAH